ncbi:lipocalin family protein [bacterium]|nr:lipocalin family protein [bacterium]
MRRDLFTIAFIFLFGLTFLTTISCEKIRDSSLVGIWKAEHFIGQDFDTVKVATGEEITLTIADDGFGNIRRTFKQEDFRWRTLPSKFTMMFHDNINETIIYKLSNDTLTMTFEDGEVYIFTKRRDLKLMK